MEPHRLFTIMATPVEVAAVVDRSHWPVHVTIVGNFRVDPEEHDALTADVAAVAGGLPAFDVRLGSAARFGAALDIPVLLAEHPMFHRLHRALAARIGLLPSFAPVEPAYWGRGYRPHATLGNGVSAADGDLLKIRWLTLIALDGKIGRPLSAVQLSAP